MPTLERPQVTTYHPLPGAPRGRRGAPLSPSQRGPEPPACAARERGDDGSGDAGSFWAALRAVLAGSAGR